MCNRELKETRLLDLCIDNLQVGIYGEGISMLPVYTKFSITWSPILHSGELPSLEEIQPQKSDHVIQGGGDREVHIEGWNE